MIKNVLAAALILIITGTVMAESVSIYDIQYTTNPDGNSPEDGNFVDCNGIVVYVTTKYKPKIILYDGEHNEGWGGIILKDWTSSVPGDVNVGDKFQFNNVLVEEFLGTTFLQYKTNSQDPNFVVDSSHFKLSSGNPLPEAIPVRVGEIEAPIENPADVWSVDNHDAEKYEGMFVKVIDVNVAGLGYGKQPDNYALNSNVDPNTCWATDFLNEDNTTLYHDLVQIGQNFCGVTGFVEQYTGTDDGIYFDYYQIITTVTEDFLLEQIADLNGDCAVDFADFATLAEHWLDGTYWN